MKTRTPSLLPEGHTHLASRFLATLSVLAFGLVALAFIILPRASAAANAAQQSGGGLYFNAEANAKDVGLPIYPGARPHADNEDNKSSAKFGLWGNAFAFKLAVVKLESNDPPEKIAAFYKKALAKYGKVLDCAAAPAKSSDNASGKSSNQLDCEADRPEPGNLVFKSGTKEKQHVVAIQPNGKGSLFQLVYVESPDSNKTN